MEMVPMSTNNCTASDTTVADDFDIDKFLPTVQELVEREPAFGMLLIDAWGKGFDAYVTYKRWLEQLIGFFAIRRDDPLLRTCKSYDVALKAMVNALRKEGQRSWR
jgi:hypothetical protein